MDHDPIAANDQACVEAKLEAKTVATYYKSLVAEDLDPWTAMHLASAYQHDLIFGGDDDDDV